MKKALFSLITLVLLLSSCISPKTVYNENSHFIDYGYFAEKGFFITESNSVSFDYVPVGNVSTIAQAGRLPISNRKANKTTKIIGDDLYSSKAKKEVKYGEWKTASIDDALDLIYQQAIKQGANGLINIKIEYLPTQTVIEGKLYHGPGYRISGMAIKR